MAADRAMLASAMVVVAGAGCGIGFADDASGGDGELPTVGAGPFQRLPFDENTPADEPWLATDRLYDFTEPAIVARGDGGFVYYLARESPDPPLGDTQIWRGAVADPVELPVEGPAVVLSADLAWEEGHVTAPSIVAPDGTAGRQIMFYEGGLATPQMGRAESTDGGVTWQKSAAPVLSGVLAPSVATDGRTWLAAFTRPGEPGLWLARSTDGVAWTVDAEAFLHPSGVADSFERVSLASPALAWLVESTGRGHWSVWYGGLEKVPDPGDAARYAIGYAASFDGMAWGRLSGGRPVLAAPAGAPAVLVEGPTATLLFDAPNGRRQAVGVATHP